MSLPSHICALAAAMILLVCVPALAQTDKPAAPDWITTTNNACKVWNPQPQPNESVTWSGACKDGLASGKGVLHWTEDGKPDAEFDGEYANGKRNGPGVIITPDGKRFEGFWSDDDLVPRDNNSI